MAGRAAAEKDTGGRDRVRRGESHHLTLGKYTVRLPAAQLQPPLCLYLPAPGTDE
jgi:hypothetical protein